MSPAERQQSIELLDTLTRLLSEWTNPVFMERIGVEAEVEWDSSALTVLTIVGRHGPLRPSAIAQRMATGASNVSKIMGRLEAAGLIERVQDPEDARATLTLVTAAGREAANRLDDAGVLTIEAMLKGWTASERTRFGASLRRFEQATMEQIALYDDAQ